MMIQRISLDFETRGPVDIRDCGAFKYAEHPDTSVLVIALSADGGPVETWDVVNGGPALGTLKQAIIDGAEIAAFNSEFEWCILKHVCPRQFGLPVPDINRMRCTAAVARMAGCPPSLAKGADFLKLDFQKDQMGAALMRKFSIPDKDGNFVNPGDNIEFTAGGVRMTAAEGFKRYVDYCRQDVEVEMEMSAKLESFRLKGLLLEGFLMTARMNDRGIPVDVTALENAQRIIEHHEEILKRRFVEITGLNPSQTAKVTEWLQANGYPGDKINKEQRERHAECEDMADTAREALAIRGELSFAAVKKVKSFLNRVMSDGRLRGAFIFYGAQKTGRWTSEGVQTQNAKKPPKWFRYHAESAFQDLASGIDYDTFGQFYGNPFETIANLVRYFIRYPDRNIFDADFAQVEARILPALIECERLLDIFRSGADPYIGIANRLGFDRDVGKTITLATQFEGGWRAVWNATGGRLSEAECRKAAAAVREENPEFKPAWRKFHQSWVDALKRPGQWVRVTKHVSMGYTTKGPFPRLLMKLPSGRSICYPYPKSDPITLVRSELPNGKVEWLRRDGHLNLDEVIGFHSYDLSFYGHVENSMYGRVETRGGDLLQSATQGTGVDLLMYGCIEAEKRGFLPMLAVHDQVLVPADGDINDMISALCSVPDWFEGFPLDADANEVRSYCKT